MEHAADTSFEELLRGMQVWRGGSADLAPPAIPTGFDELDRYLPGGGWPRGAVSEICVDHYGIGELGLLAGGLARAEREQGEAKQWIVWVAPPFVPYAPALQRRGIDLGRQLLVHPRAGRKSSLKAIEQAVRSGSCAAVLAWVRAADEVDLRRLQLAAEERSCWVVLFRPAAALQHRSPAALRLTLSRHGARLRVGVAKCRGRQPTELSFADFAEHG